MAKCLGAGKHFNVLPAIFPHQQVESRLDRKHSIAVLNFNFNGVLGCGIQGLQGAFNKNWGRNTALAVAAGSVVAYFIFETSRRLEQR